MDSYKAMVEALFATLDGFQAILDDQFATDDRVVRRWRASGVHVGDFSGIPATGRTVKFAGMSLWEFEGGKARRGWSFPDVAAIMSQLLS